MPYKKFTTKNFRFLLCEEVNAVTKKNTITVHNYVIEGRKCILKLLTNVTLDIYYQYKTDEFFRQSNIILMGSPGCGKTTVGRMLSAKFGRPVLDIDDDHLEPYWGIPVSQKVYV